MASPVVKWVGGKRQLLSVLKEKITVPFNTYYEPFFGGGALFFALAPEKAVINDINSELINLYRQLKRAPQALIKELKLIQEHYNSLKTDALRTDYYLQQRARFNELIIDREHSREAAVLFIFLNKASYNGLYRVNQQGLFNAPSGHKEQVHCYNEDNLIEVSKLLKHCKICNQDFASVCKNAEKGDFIFFDSPYFDTFTSYQSQGFTLEDHQRLASLFKKLTEKGVFCLLTNSNTEYIRELYSDYIISTVNVKRYINCDASGRDDCKEIIIQNF
ncbi:MAG: DNA adenine methylase [Succinivibrio sp.]